MVQRDFLPRLNDLIDILYKPLPKEQAVLKEDGVMRPIPLLKSGINYRLFSFDKKYRRGQCPNRLFTFFSTITGAQTMCDYCLVGVKKGKLFVLLFELKKGDEQVMDQLKAGEVFAKFIISSVNRINGWSVQPEIRFISVRASNVLLKSTTRISPVSYDANKLYTFKGATIDVNACMV